MGVAGKVGRITTAGVVTEFSVPSIPPAAGSSPATPSTPATLTAITAGPDGALWFTGEPGEVGRITTTGVVTEFPVPDDPPPSGSPAGTAGTPATLQSIAAGPDGALWFTGQGEQVGRITTAGVVTEFSVPDAPPLEGSTPATSLSDPGIQTIVAGPDGNLWFTTSSNLTSSSTTGSNYVWGNPSIGRLTPARASSRSSTWFKSGNTKLSEVRFSKMPVSSMLVLGLSIPHHQKGDRHGLPGYVLVLFHAIRPRSGRGLPGLPQWPAQRLLPQERRDLAVQVLAGAQPVSDLARQHEVSRKFLYQQAHTAKRPSTKPSPPHPKLPTTSSSTCQSPRLGCGNWSWA